MKKLVQEKERAIALRKKGFSYNEILKQVPVAKSSLSLWLKDLPLTKQEKDILRRRKNTNISRGRIKAAGVLHQNKLDRQKFLLYEAKKTFDQYKEEPLFHTGVALYWAEGGKRTDQFQFMNSDASMISVLITWLESYTDYSKGDLSFRLYIHKPYIHENCELYWKNQLRIETSQFKKTILKPTGFGVKKRPQYRGCMRLEVPRSSALLLKMKFWIAMLVEHHHNQ